MTHSLSEQEEVISIPPTQTTDLYTRIFSLDVLRGIAILGILLISIWEFGGFSTNEQTKLYLVQKGNNYSLFAAMQMLFEGKMRALLSIVFGAGMTIYLQKSVTQHFSHHELFIKKQMWLMAFGLMNAFIFLWPGDILFQYGVMGILLFPFFRMPKQKLLIAALVVLLIHTGKLYWYYSDDKEMYQKYKAVTQLEEKFKKDSTERHRKDSAAGLSKETIAKNDSIAKKKDTLNKIQQGDKGAWEGKLKSLKYDSTNASVKAENKKMQSGYGEIWSHLMERSQQKEAAWLYRTGIWDIGSMMLLGMALWGLGFFDSNFSRNKYLVITLIGIAVGVVLAWLRVEWQHVKLTDYEKYIIKKPIPPNQFFAFERACLAMGYLSLIMLLIRLNVFTKIFKAIAGVGRMALTQYLLQSIVCTVFFYGYGMGYFGRLSLTQLYLFVAELWLVQIVISYFWLKYYNYGPAEWLWRRLTVGKKIPSKK